MSVEDDVRTMAAARRRCDADEIACWSVQNAFFKSWTFWRAEMVALPPLPLHLAASGSHVVLVEREEGFKTLTDAEAISVGSGERAIAYVEMFIAMTWPSARVVRSIAEVAGVTNDDGSDLIAPPKATTLGGGYRVELSVLDDGSIFECTASIDGRGAITLEPTLVEEGLSCFSVTE